MTKISLESVPINAVCIADSREALRLLPDESVQTIITSPPYNIGKEYEIQLSMAKFLVEIKMIISDCYRCLKPGGSIFWQVGNHVENGVVTPLDIVMWPIFSDLGATLRNRIIWTFGHGLHCKKRFSGRHESILWFTKGDNYTFDLDAVRVPSKYPNKRYYKGPNKGKLSGNPLGKNPSDVWDITNVKHNHPEKTEHPCQFPEALVERAILCSSSSGELVLDPFLGSGTTAVAAIKSGRRWIGIERNSRYAKIARKRIEMAKLSL